MSKVLFLSTGQREGIVLFWKNWIPCYLLKLWIWTLIKLTRHKGKKLSKIYTPFKFTMCLLIDFMSIDIPSHAQAEHRNHLQTSWVCWPILFIPLMYFYSRRPITWYFKWSKTEALIKSNWSLYLKMLTELKLNGFRGNLMSFKSVQAQRTHISTMLYYTLSQHIVTRPVQLYLMKDAYSSLNLLVGIICLSFVMMYTICCIMTLQFAHHLRSFLTTLMIWKVDLAEAMLSVMEHFPKFLPPGCAVDG